MRPGVTKAQPVLGAIICLATAAAVVFVGVAVHEINYANDHPYHYGARAGDRLGRWRRRGTVRSGRALGRRSPSGPLTEQHVDLALGAATVALNRISRGVAPRATSRCWFRLGGVVRQRAVALLPLPRCGSERRGRGWRLLPIGVTQARLTHQPGRQRPSTR